uniref:Uncharacterized protein n=1 Tax=Monopterus albus TaxID=43700 RepID=A0A3Q3K1H4_MONAL
MCTTVDTGEIIILSDDDDDDDGHEEPSVLIVEVQDLKKNGNNNLIYKPTVCVTLEVVDSYQLLLLCVSDVVLPQGPLDEDLVVTFSRRAEVLPHARYDCPIHPFMATDHEVSGPVASNQLICDQCFCYICDKLASLCVVWCQGGVCHCNSHKRSDFWNNIRNGALLGWLKTFNLSLSEVDHHLRLAGICTQLLQRQRRYTLDIHTISCLYAIHRFDLKAILCCVVSAGTESCIATCESSWLKDTNCECS